MPLPTQDQITEKLRAVIDPELRRSIVELGMVRSIEVKDDGQVDVVVSLTTAGCPIRSHFEQAVAKQVSELDGVTGVAVGFDVLSDEEKGALQKTLGRGKLPAGALAQVKNVICVASGKGGVGKSTMTANLAAALSAEGHPAGALDCDVYGYSIPRMLGVNRKPEVNAERKILPLEAAGGRQGDVDRLLRRGELRRRLARADAAQGDPAVPRGRRLGRAGVPAARPAAGDRRRLDDSRPAPPAGEVPDRHDAAAGGADASPSAAPRWPLKFDLELLGAIENMSGFTTPDGERFTIFGEGGGQLLADELDIPLLGKIPLSEALREHADAGTPLVTAEPDAPAAQAIRQAARGIVAATPQELPVLQAVPAAVEAPPVGGIPLPVVQG